MWSPAPLLAGIAILVTVSPPGPARSWARPGTCYLGAGSSCPRRSPLNLWKCSLHLPDPGMPTNENPQMTTYITKQYLDGQLGENWRLNKFLMGVLLTPCISPSVCNVDRPGDVMWECFPCKQLSVQNKSHRPFKCEVSGLLKTF